MGNYVRAVRELPKLKRQLEEVTAKRLQAERHLKVLKDDLERKGQFLEKQRAEAINSSSTTVESLKSQMDAELKAVQDENEKLEKVLQARRLPKDTDDADGEAKGSAAGGRRRRRS